MAERAVATVSSAVTPSKRIRASGVKVLPLGLLERPLALLDSARSAAR